MTDLQRSTNSSVLDAAPNRADLLHTMQSAESNSRGFYKVSWRITDSQHMRLVCQVPNQQVNLIKRNHSADSSVMTEPNWTLTVIEEGKQDTVVWTHFTRDLDLITNMMAMSAESLNKPETPDSDQKVTTNLAKLRPSDTVKKALKQTGFNFKPTESPRQTMSSELTLAGDLRNVDISNVLQTANLLAMSGKLSCTNVETQIDVFFTEGVINHAGGNNPLASSSSQELSPHQLVLELILWKDGKFRFYPGWTSSDTTITSRLESLLLEGATVADYNNVLEEMEFTQESLLVREKDLSLDDLKTTIKTGVPTDLELQEKLYQKITDTPIASSIILEQIPRTQWIPAVYNLLHLGLISIFKESDESQNKQESPPDEALVEKGLMSICRQDTKILAHSTFHYFVNKEISRSKHRQGTLALALLKVPPCNTKQYSELRKVFNQLKRDYDELGHFDETDAGNFGMLLPYRSSSQAYRFMEKIVSLLKEGSFEEGIHVGISAYPQSKDLDELVENAYKARDRAQEIGITISTDDKIEASDWFLKYKAAQELLKVNEIQEAINILNNCLVEAKSFDENDERLVMTLDNLSQAYIDIKRYDLAITALKISLNIKEKHYLPEDVAHCLFKMGKCYFKLRQYDQAESTLLRAVNAFVRCYGSQDETVGNAYHNLATLYHLTDRLDEGKTAYHKCLTIKRSLLGRSSPEVVKIQENYMLLLKSDSEQAMDQVGLISGEWRAVRIDDPLGQANSN